MVDGMTLSRSGVFSGTPTQTGVFNFTAQVSDSASPGQTASRAMTLNVVPAIPPAPPLSVLLCDNFNAAEVTQQPNGPPNATRCTLSNRTTITQVATYHWNSGQGATPGTISLQRVVAEGGFFGPFTAVGSAGQNNVANAAWLATPNVTVPADTYVVLDSGPSTWSFNTTSSNSGFVRVWGFANPIILTFVTQPTTTLTGQVISPAVQVRATDSTGAVLSSLSISLSIGSNPGGGTLSGTTMQTTAVSGIATFSNLSIDKPGTGYTLTASATGVAATTSSAFSIVPLSP
jgi:hypothetical protein